MKFVIGLGVLFLFLFGCGLTSDEGGLIILAIQGDNMPINDAYIEIINTTTGENYQPTTNEVGIATIALPQGTYQLTATHPQYNTQTKTVTLTTDETKEITFNLTLKTGQVTEFQQQILNSANRNNFNITNSQVMEVPQPLTINCSTQNTPNQLRGNVFEETDTPNTITELDAAIINTYFTINETEREEWFNITGDQCCMNLTEPQEITNLDALATHAIALNTYTTAGTCQNPQTPQPTNQQLTPYQQKILENAQQYGFNVTTNDVIQLTPTPQFNCQQGQLIGDVDSDGTITPLDAAITITAWLDRDESFMTQQSECIEATFDDEISNLDALAINEIAEGRVTEMGIVGSAYPGRDAVSEDFQEIVGEHEALEIGDEFTAGDLDGDGLPDLIIGAPKYKYEGSRDTRDGRVYIFYGREGGLRDFRNVNDADATITGQTDGDSFFGASVSIGDVTGDGKMDLGVTAFYHNGRDNSAAFIFKGNGNRLSGELSWEEADIKIFKEGPQNSGSVIQMNIDGDFDGDGINDIIISSAELLNDNSLPELHLFRGKANLPEEIIINEDESDGIVISEQAGDFFGNVINYAGDVDGDGKDEILVGARAHDDIYPNAGAAYLINGEQALGSDPINIQTLVENNGAVKFKDHSQNTSLAFGTYVNKIGDFDGDGTEDFGIFEPLSGNYGKLFVFYGGGNYEGIEFVYGNTDEFYGAKFSTAGDIDGDGIDDLLLGIKGRMQTRDYQGAAEIIQGRSDRFENFPKGTNQFCRNNPNCISTHQTTRHIVKFVGEDFYDWFGSHVEGGHDFNQDGKPDLLIGAFATDNPHRDGGEIRIYYTNDTYFDT